MNVRWLIPIPMAVVGFAIGYLGPSAQDSSSSAKSSAPGQAPAVPALRSTARDEPSSTREEHAAALAEQLRLAAWQGSHAHRVHDLTEFFQRIGVEDMAGLAEAVLKMPKGSRDVTLGALCDRWVEIDVRGALAFEEKTRGDSSKQDALLLQYGLLEAWTRRDPMAALEWTKNVPYARRADMQKDLAAVLSAECAGGPAKAVALLRDTGLLGLDQGIGKTLFIDWAKRDPQAAMAGAAGIGNVKLRRALLNGALQGWIETDPDAAAAWCRKLDDPKLRDEAAGTLAVGLVRHDLGQSLAVARSLPAGRRRDETLAAVADTLCKTGRTKEALEFIGEIPLEPGNKTLTEFYDHWASADDEAAVTYLCDRLTETPPASAERNAVESFLDRQRTHLNDRNGAAVARALTAGFVEGGEFGHASLLADASARWASGNLAEARTWAEALPENAVRESALSGVAYNWAEKSSDEAARWLATLPPSRSRSAAVRGYMIATLPRDPDSALSLLHRIMEEKERLSMLQSLWTQWAQFHPKEAAQWRESSLMLSAAERALLVAPK